MIKQSLPLLIISSLLPLSSCKSQNINEITTNQRQEMAPAKTADEWLERLHLDLNHSHHSSNKIATLYSELPPLDQWPAIITKLEEITTDKESYAEFTNTKEHVYYHSSKEKRRLKLKLFSTLLTENGTDAEPTFRKLLKVDPNISEYRYDQTLNNLLLLSKNSQKSITWFQANITKNGSSSRYSKNDRTPSQLALAQNKIDQGIKLLLEEINQAKTSRKGALISKLAKIAHLLNKPELGKKAMSMLEKNLIEEKKNGSYLSTYDYRGALDYLIHTAQYQRLIDLQEKLQNTKSEDNDHYISSNNSNDLNNYKLTALSKLGKTAVFETSIKELLLKYKTTPKKFLNELESSVANQPSIGSIYIDILSNKPDQASKDQAYTICSHLLTRNQGTDAYYKRAIALDRKSAATLIASLRIYDPFEERPLIWQAEIALAAGKIDLADKLIQQAIALDPSDGDHGKFTRMHCYDVLARISTKQGNTEKATSLNQVVISIRQGEAADDYLYAGLIQEATDRYRKALGHFNEAYCLQSRLAKTLMEAGKFDEAIPHFKKAFELMPVSFGPRESHCFGCEGLFDDIRVQNLALPTLTAFLEKEPENPRTPYLLGLLFEEMKKEPEAISAYQKAIQLDPQYYNAASRLQKLIKKDPSKFAQSQALNKQLFEIAAYHKKPDYLPSHLLKTYWQEAKNFPPSPIKLTSLSSLGFTNTTLTNKQYKETPFNQEYYQHSSTSEDAIDGWSAKELLLKNSFINRAID